MQLEQISNSGGVVVRTFNVDGVAGALWSPEVSAGPTPLVLVRCGGTAGAAAERFARVYGFHAAIADAADAQEWRVVADALTRLPGVDRGRVGRLGPRTDDDAMWHIARDLLVP